MIWKHPANVYHTQNNINSKISSYWNKEAKMWLYFPRIFQWPLCEYVWLLGTKNNDGVATSFRRNPWGKGSREMFLLLFSHVLFNVGSFCTLSSSCAFCNSPNVYFGIFFYRSSSICQSLSVSFYIPAPNFFIFHCLFLSVLPDSGLYALYYMLTLLLRLALAIIGCLASSLYITYTHKHTHTPTHTHTHKRGRERKGRAKKRDREKGRGVVAAGAWAWSVSTVDLGCGNI